MKEIKILHLFPKLLSLYGEYANLTVLKSELNKAGYKAEISYFENGELNISGYDLIYIGSGTEDNLIEALKRLLPYNNDILSSYNKGDLWLTTGNSMALFGNVISYKDETYNALNIFSYKTNIVSGKRFLGDALTKDNKVGFINNSCIYEGIDSHLFELILNTDLGNSKKDAFDGFKKNNFYATELIGPVISKNPDFLEEIASHILGEKFTLPLDSTIKKAYEISLNELKKRLESTK